MNDMIELSTYKRCTVFYASRSCRKSGLCYQSLMVRYLLLILKQVVSSRKEIGVILIFMQECAYAIMWEERTGIPITQLITFIAVDNSSPLIYVEHRDDWVNPLRDLIKQYEEENTSVEVLTL